MSSSDAAAARHLAHHFESLEKQGHASRLGMWLFLATEVLLFAGLFVAYTGYRFLYPETFRAGSEHLDLRIGAVNTVVLITSSLTVALAVSRARAGRARAAVWLLGATVVLAALFLVFKGFEYAHHIHVGALPGRLFQYPELAHRPGMPMFYTLYFFTTGLHAFHVLVGMVVLSWVAVSCARGRYSPAYHMPVELGGLYWHLVDLIWIFLFPLLYLV